MQFWLAKYLMLFVECTVIEINIGTHETGHVQVPRG